MPHPYKQFYRRKLPHIQPPNATFFVTFRLAGSVPKSELAQWKQEKRWLEGECRRLTGADESPLEIDQQQRARLQEFHRSWFVKFEEILHKEETGPVWMKDPLVADLIQEFALSRWQGFSTRFIQHHVESRAHRVQAVP